MAPERHDALAEGNPIEALTALRREAAANLLAADPKEFAGLSREYRAIVAELERRGAGREESKTDDIAAQRAKRRAAGVKTAAGS